MTLRSLLLVAFVLATLWLACLLVIFEPVWETNDDVAMAMVAHGYGFASTGSANLLFSNVLFGYIVRVLQGVGGLQGYSVGMSGELPRLQSATSSSGANLLARRHLSKGIPA